MAGTARATTRRTQWLRAATGPSFQGFCSTFSLPPLPATCPQGGLASSRHPLAGQVVRRQVPAIRSPFLPPAFFNQIAEAIEWILHNTWGIRHIIHYLDDIFTAGPRDSDECERNMVSTNALCRTIGAPTKPEKEEGPSTTLTFLGILLDSATMTASITEERKTELQQAIHQLEGRRTCTKRELLSLIGKLAFACKVVPPGRLFLRRLIDLSTTVRHLHHHATLNKAAAARADLAWWRHFLPTWPGASLFLQSDWTPAPDMKLFTDASNLGYGTYILGRTVV